MKKAEIKDMSPDQLDDQLVKLKKEQFNLRFQRGFRSAREYVARAPGAPRHRPHHDICPQKRAGSAGKGA